MSKKTKKEKIIADLRRKLNDEGSQAPIYNLSKNFQNETDGTKDIVKPNLSFPTSAHLPPSQTQSLYIYPVQLIKKDLTKTFLLCILAISLEVALFLLLERHIVLPFK